MKHGNVRLYLFTSDYLNRSQFIASQTSKHGENTDKYK